MKLICLLALLLAGFGPGLDSAFSSRDVVLRVDAVHGNDGSGDGSAGSPFRTLTCALARAASDSPRVISLAPGRYDVSLGEHFPLAVPAGTRIEGAPGKGETRPMIAGDGGQTLLRLLHAPGPPGDKGATTGATSSAEKPAGLLRGLRLTGGAPALEIASPPGSTESWRLEDLEIEDSRRGIAVSGEGTVSLTMSGCRVSRCDVGLHLDAGTGEGRAGTRHRIEVSESRFEACRQAGVLREGPDGRNISPHPYLFRDCRFEGNEVGLHFTLPGGDAPIRVSACRFIKNRSVGMRLAGQAGDPDQQTRIEDCRFETNGTGLYLTNLQVTSHVNRCRFIESVGNGLFVGCFAGAPGRTIVTNGLFARNGANGLLAVADGSSPSLVVAGGTFVANKTAGLFTKLRHGATQERRVVNSIFWNNARDIVGFEPVEIDHCLVQNPMLAKGSGNLTMDPLFESPVQGSYQLAPGSPAVDAGLQESAELEGDLDLDARPRVRDGNDDGEALIDLGAFERQRP